MAHSGAPCGGTELDGSPEFLNFLATLPDLSGKVAEDVENLSSRTLMNEFRAKKGKGVHNDVTPIHHRIICICLLMNNIVATYSRNATGVYE